MLEGLIEGLSMKEYRSESAYSASDIIGMSRSISRWKYEKENPRKKTRAMEVGSAFHLVIQSEITGTTADLKNGLAVYEDGTWRTKAFEKFALERPDMHVVDAEEHDLIKRMTSSVLAEPEVLHYLVGAIVEPSLFVKDPEFRFMRKCRPDFIHLQKGVSINIKTTSDASEKGFLRSIADYGYDFQSCNYQDILRLHYGKSFDEIHILVEKSDEGPCKVAIRGIDDDTLDQARSQMRLVFEKIVECEKSGKWEDEKAALMIAQVPQWARTIVNP